MSTATRIIVSKVSHSSSSSSSSSIHILKVRHESESNQQMTTANIHTAAVLCQQERAHRHGTVRKSEMESITQAEQNYPKNATNDTQTHNKA